MKSALILPIFITIPALAETSFDTTEKFAWGANTGWLSFRHDTPASPAGVVFGGAFLSGYAWCANTGWINFGDGTPTNGYQYSNTADDHGVNHDGTGNLSGYAWSANTGWINFGWASPSDPHRPRVDLLSGAFSGYAWGANTGWLNLGTGRLTALKMLDDDSDGDGIPDWWEMFHFQTVSAINETTDTDGDGFPDLSEYHADTDPDNPLSNLKVVFQLHRPEGPQTTLTFTSGPTRLYRIEHSNELTPPWTDSALGVFLPDTGLTTTRSITYPSNPRKFFRVVALVPLSP